MFLRDHVGATATLQPAVTHAETSANLFFWVLRRRRRGSSLSRRHHRCQDVHDLNKSTKGDAKTIQHHLSISKDKKGHQCIETSQTLKTVLAHPPGMDTTVTCSTTCPFEICRAPALCNLWKAECHLQTSCLLVPQLPHLSWRCTSPSLEAELQQRTSRLLGRLLCFIISGGRASSTDSTPAVSTAVAAVGALYFAISGGRASTTSCSGCRGTVLGHLWRPSFNNGLRDCWSDCCTTQSLEPEPH